MPMPRRRPDLATGVEQAIPYDQTGLSGADAPPDAGAPPMGGAPDPGAGAMPPPDGGMDLGAMGQPDVGADATGMDASMDPSGGAAPEDLQVQQMAQALDDPNVPPEEKIAIQQQLALAARRQLAGLGQ